jgi:hypothetical protein
MDFEYRYIHRSPPQSSGVSQTLQAIQSRGVAAENTNQQNRHVVLPAEVARLCPKNKLLSENEWRQLGVQQSRGWVHYAIHRSLSVICLAIFLLSPRPPAPPLFPALPPSLSPPTSSICLRAHAVKTRPEPHILLFRRPLETDPVCVSMCVWCGQVYLYCFSSSPSALNMYV